jgi:predicted ATP-grasp superfamily ATP-dependent carboligase
MLREQSIVIVGASARAAAFSALRAGLSPWCADLFADADLRNRCPVCRIPAREYPHGLVPAVQHAPPGPVLYTGALENRPALVRRLARSRPLWGNDPEVLKTVRAPELLVQACAVAGIPCPAVRREPPRSTPGRWLVKPIGGSGGAGVHRFGGATHSTRHLYFQEYVEGEPGAAVFVGNSRSAQPLGVTRQLVGVPWLHAAPFHYCGSIGALEVSTEASRDLNRLGNALARSGLRGLFGVDFILNEGRPWAVEVNPRYTASVEILEYATGISAMAMHRAVFQLGASEPIPRAKASAGVVGKAILYARAALRFPPDGRWTSALHRSRPVNVMPDFADIPLAGEPIAARRPVLTIFARGDSEAECLRALKGKAAHLDRRLHAR